MAGCSHERRPCAAERTRPRTRSTGKVKLITRAEIIKRWTVCVAGILFTAAGIALLTKAGLGTSQISSLPYVMSLILPITFGTASFLMNAFFIIAQVCILRREYKKTDLLQLPLTFAFGFFIDLMMFVFAPISPTFYVAKIALALAGSASVAFGVSLQITSNVSILPADGIIRVIARKSSMHFGTVKTVFDLALVASSVILSFAVLRKLAGVREGTVIAALLVGNIARFFLAHLDWLERWTGRELGRGKAANEN